MFPPAREGDRQRAGRGHVSRSPFGGSGATTPPAGYDGTADEVWNQERAALGRCLPPGSHHEPSGPTACAHSAAAGRCGVGGV